jgi:hypothetical protein
MRIVINHPRAVIPEEEERILDVLQHAAGQFQRRAGLKVLLSWPGNLGSRLGHVQPHEERNARVRGDGALVKARVAKRHELDGQLPVLQIPRRGRRTRLMAHFTPNRSSNDSS